MTEVILYLTLGLLVCVFMTNAAEDENKLKNAEDWSLILSWLIIVVLWPLFVAIIAFILFRKRRKK